MWSDTVKRSYARLSVSRYARLSVSVGRPAWWLAHILYCHIHPLRCILSTAKVEQGVGSGVAAYARHGRDALHILNKDGIHGAAGSSSNAGRNGLERRPTHQEYQVKEVFHASRLQVDASHAKDLTVEAEDVAVEMIATPALLRASRDGRDSGGVSWSDTSSGGSHGGDSNDSNRIGNLRLPRRPPPRPLPRGPSYFIIGSPRCGTTALHDLLTRHPAVKRAAAKEINCFNSRAYLTQPIERYLDLFPSIDRRGAISGDGSVTSLLCATAADRISRFVTAVPSYDHQPIAEVRKDNQMDVFSRVSRTLGAEGRSARSASATGGFGPIDVSHDTSKPFNFPAIQLLLPPLKLILSVNRRK